MLSAGSVYLDQVLIYDAACTDVEVSYLRVAHLALRQPHILSAGFKKRYGILRPEPVQIGSALGIDGVGAVMLSLAPTVENHQ